MSGELADEGQNGATAFVKVLTVRDGRIVDIQDCRDERAARRFAQRG